MCIGDIWGEFECNGRDCECICEDEDECTCEGECTCDPNKTTWRYIYFLNHMFIGPNPEIWLYDSYEGVNWFMDIYFIPKLMSLLKDTSPIDFESLCREAFKPSRVMHQLSLDPEYYD